MKTNIAMVLLVGFIYAGTASAGSIHMNSKNGPSQNSFNDAGKSGKNNYQGSSNFNSFGNLNEQGIYLLISSSNSRDRSNKDNYSPGDTIRDKPVVASEPATLALLSLGLVVMGYGYKRRQSNNSYA